MWDCHWQPKRDYGTRYDWGFFEAHPQMMKDFWTHKKRDPEVGWVASVLFQPERCKLPENTELYDQAEWNKAGLRMGGLGKTRRLQFTRGTIAALWAMEKWPGSEIILLGFDNIVKGVSLPLRQAFCEAYRKNPGTFTFANYQGGETKHGNHDFAVELPLLLRASRELGCSLRTADQVFA
jgi:hypothetical protein